MVASQIRANARESLTGKWGEAAVMTLVYGIVTWVINFVCNLIPVIGPVAVFVISTPISYGLIVSFMKPRRGEEVGYVDFLSNGFSYFGRVWGVVGNTILKMILPICLVVISVVLLTVSMSGVIFGAFGAAASPYTSSAEGVMAGFGFLGFISIILYIAALIYTIVKGYLYSLTMYILYDNDNMTGKQIVEESERLMRGHRLAFFFLGLSFIGWAILAAFTLGIGMLWLMPYMMIAMICFYEDLAGKNNVAVESNVTENPVEK